MVYSWGNDINQTGILALGNTYYQSTPVLNNNFINKKIIDISISEQHGVALDICHHIYTWGTGNNGELGLKTISKTTAPIRIETELLFVKTKCGSTSTIVLDINNDAYFIGVINREFNQSSYLALLINNTLSNKDTIFKPIQFNIQSRIENMFCGEKMIALIDIYGFLFLYSENEGLNKVLLNKKIKTVKFIRSNIYALTKESDYLYLFSSRTEMNILKEYVENVFCIDPTYSKLNIIDTPFYNDALFFSLECTNNNKKRVESKEQAIFFPLKSKSINSPILCKEDDLIVNNTNNYINLNNVQIKNNNEHFNNISSSFNSSQGLNNKRKKLSCSNNLELGNDNTFRISQGSNTSNPECSRIDRISTLLDKILEQKLDSVLSSSNELKKSNSYCLGKKRIELERADKELHNNDEFNKRLSKQSNKARNKDLSHDYSQSDLFIDSRNKKNKRNQSQEILPKYFDLNQVYNKNKATEESEDNRLRTKMKAENKRNQTNNEDYKPIKVFFGNLTQYNSVNNILTKSEIREVSIDNPLLLNNQTTTQENNNTNHTACYENVQMKINDDSSNQRIQEYTINQSYSLNGLTKYYSELSKQEETHNQRLIQQKDNYCEKALNNANNMIKEQLTNEIYKKPFNISLKTKMSLKDNKELSADDQVNDSQASIKLDSRSSLKEDNTLLNKNNYIRRYINESNTTRSTQRNRNYCTKSINTSNKQNPNDQEINHINYNTIDQNLLLTTLNQNDNQFGHHTYTPRQIQEEKKEVNEKYNLILSNNNLKENNKEKIHLSVESDEFLQYNNDKVNASEHYIKSQHMTNKNAKTNFIKYPINYNLSKSESMISIHPIKQRNYDYNNYLNNNNDEGREVIGKYMDKKTNLSHSHSMLFDKEKEKRLPRKINNQIKEKNPKGNKCLKPYNTTINEMRKKNEIQHLSELSLKILDKAKAKKDNKDKRPKELFRSKRNNSTITSNYSEGTDLFSQFEDKPMLNKEQRNMRLNNTNKHRNNYLKQLSIGSNVNKPKHLQMETPYNSQYPKPKALQTSLDLFKQKLFGYLENNYGKNHNEIINQFLFPNKDEEKNCLLQDFFNKELNANDFIDSTESAISYNELQEDVKNYIINNLQNSQIKKIKENIGNIVNINAEPAKAVSLLLTRIIYIESYNIIRL